MITLLTNQQQILDFCYLHEKENLFTIGSFNLRKNPFETNLYGGYFKNNELIGLSTYFGIHKSFVINAEQKEVIKALVDFNIEQGVEIESIPCFKKYADVMLERLKSKHRLIPKKNKKETVYILTKKDFQDFSKGTEEQATEKDIDELVLFYFHNNVKTHRSVSLKEITEQDRKRIHYQTEFIIRKDNTIISKANIHGISKHYFQIGGVGTLEKYRNQGCAKQTVSALCKHYFNQGLTYGLLFTDNTNTPAQSVYQNIGFKPVNDFIIAEF